MDRFAGKRKVRRKSATVDVAQLPLWDHPHMARRSRGTGRLFVRTDSRGSERWYGQWWVGNVRTTRLVGPKRQTGSRQGLTRSQAERELQRKIAEELKISVRSSSNIEETGTALIAHLETLERKRSTLGDYASYLRIHLVPFFGSRDLARIQPADIETFIAQKRREGCASKSILNYLGFLHSIFTYAEKRGQIASNPVKLVDRPRQPQTNPDVRFLDDAELEALLAAVPDDDRGGTERAIYLTAAMTGLRQGELLALRWRDIDWLASRVRVRQNYVRGEFGTPKSRRSTRSVPLADRAAGELDRHFQASAYIDDDDLVFCHPQSGLPLDRSRLLKRLKTAAKRAPIRELRFHDLRHTFGTRMAGAGVPLRTLQEWMGHRDFKTTLIYADYQPSEHESAMVERAFGQDSKRDAKVNKTAKTGEALNRLK